MEEGRGVEDEHSGVMLLVVWVEDCHRKHLFGKIGSVQHLEGPQAVQHALSWERRELVRV